MQNRQLRNLLGSDGFALFEDEWRQQQELRETLRNKPSAIAEYERRLKRATFAYSKADAADRHGRAAAGELFAEADRQFERLAEYLSENIAGHADLECWLDRGVHYDASNVPTSSADSFPCVITSRSARNEGGGLLHVKRTKRQVKVDAVERALAELEGETGDGAKIAERLAVGRKLKGLAEG